MPHFVVKIGDDRYLKWSTVLDAPVTCGMCREEIKNFLMREKMQQAEFDVDGILEDADEPPSRRSLDRLAEFNRAGDHETSLSKEELIKQFWGKPES